ncbi:MAG: aminotransferase class III-fold pyridoxal phosphate-dependent enzyme, partial [Pseudomonadota bacterium]
TTAPCDSAQARSSAAAESMEITPDMVCVAKSLSSAYMPISAIMINGKLAETIAKNSDKVGVFGHGYTYSAHPVACAVANETLRIYDDENIIEHTRARASLFTTRVQELSNHSLVGNVRSVGLLGAIELTKDKMDDVVSANAVECGLLVRLIMGGSIIGICPPLIITDDEINLMFDRLHKTLDMSC